jgi:hypothetical protein
VTTVIDVFIVAYLFVAWFWRHPSETFGRVVTAPIAPLVRWGGFGQNWSMFTPDPAVSGCDLQVVIKLRSGAALVWEPPRLDALTPWGAFRRFRYRGYANAMMSTWAGDCQPTLADYLMRKYDFSEDPPVEIVFTWVDRPIAPPGQEAVPQGPVRSVFYTVTVPGNQP